MEDALLSLMEERRFQEISVKDIADKAGVARLTFYRNFETKENVLLRYFDGLFDEYLAAVRELAPCPLEEALVLCFDTWRAHKRESGLMLRDDLGALLNKPFDSYLNQALEYIVLPKDLTETQKRFVIGGMYFTMLDWLAADRGRTSRQVAREIVGFVKLS